MGKASAAVATGNVIDEIAAYVSRYVYFESPDIAPVIALWIVQTYCFEQFYYCGYIAIRSELLGSGKSVLLDVLSELCKGNPAPTVIPTEAVLFRSGKRVWLIDEVDNLRDQDAELHGRLIAVLNDGFKAKGEIIRLGKNGNGDYLPKSFSAYGPKVFAGLKKLAQTVSDRCFHVRMVKASVRPPRLPVTWRKNVAPSVRSKLKSLMEAQRGNMTQLYDWLSELGGVELLQRYDSRFQDIVEPLVVLAMIADAEYGGCPRMVKALRRGLPLLTGEREAEGVQLARAILDLEDTLLGSEDSVFILSQKLLDTVRASGFSWIDSTKALATMFKTVGLSPRSNGAAHGYDLTRAWFQEVKNSIRQGVNAAPAAGF